MTPQTLNSVETAVKRTVRELHELIAALDRRVPQVERVGEIAIARSAADLRAEAVQRIADLERGVAAGEPAVESR